MLFKWPKPVGSFNISTHSFSKNTTFLSFDQRNQLRFLKGFSPIMLLRLLLSTCRPSRWQLATTTGRKDLAADIDPPYLKNLVARKIFSNLTLHFQKFFINFWYLNEFHVHNIQLVFKELTSSIFYFAKQNCWLAILTTRESIFAINNS